MRFHLKAVDAGNRVVALQLEAPDEAAARDLARQRGYAVLALAREQWLDFSAKSAFPTFLFSIELLALLEAGLNAVEALRTLTEKAPAGGGRSLLLELLGALERGESLSQAVARFPTAFSPLYVATVRSSERTGNLAEALKRYITYQEDLDRVRKRVVAALLYPAVLLAVGSLVFAFLLFYVVPRFARVYEDISTGLPFFSSVLLGLGRWIQGNGLVAVCVLVLSALALVSYLSKNKERLLERLWRIPALGERMKIYQLARFYRTVGMLLRAGIPALRAFEMVGELLGANLRPLLLRAMVQLSEGRSISAALTDAGLATPVATRMMAVGEQGGAMGEMMDRIARFYDDETARFVDAFTRAFEPLLMAVLGFAVGLVVVLMYMPIFELAGSLQ